MLGAVAKLLFFALIVNPNFLAILKRRRGEARVESVKTNATPERSSKKSPKEPNLP